MLHMCARIFIYPCASPGGSWISIVACQRDLVVVLPFSGMHIYVYNIHKHVYIYVHTYIHEVWAVFREWTSATVTWHRRASEPAIRDWNVSRPLSLLPFLSCFLLLLPPHSLTFVRSSSRRKCIGKTTM